jgi:hypothetical protein
MKLKTVRFETMPDIRRESQTILHSIKENDFHSALKREKKDGIAAPIYPKEATFKIQQPKQGTLSQCISFLGIVGELSLRPSY